MARTTSSMSVSIAPDDFTCRMSRVERFSLASRIASRIERHVGRVEVALDLHDVDAAPAGGRGRPRPRPCRARATSTRRAATSSATPRRIRCAMRTPVASVAMDLERFCATSRVVIVAGKGGVGKTTVTAALATAAARTGMSVLIVEVEGKSGLAACFGEAPLTYEEAELRPGVRARTLTPDDALLEYLDDHGMRRISRRLSRSGALDVVATAVPGMQRHPRARQGQAARTRRRRRPDRDRRARRGPRGQLPPVGARAARRGEGRADPTPGRRRGRAAERPGPLPGDARDAPRGDAGQRAGRHRLRDRGPGRRRARARSS